MLCRTDNILHNTPHIKILCEILTTQHVIIGCLQEWRIERDQKTLT